MDRMDYQWSGDGRLDQRVFQELAFARNAVNVGKSVIKAGSKGEGAALAALDELEPHIFSALHMNQPSTAWKRIEREIACWKLRIDHAAQGAMLEALLAIRQQLESVFPSERRH
jgi:hypothetical protein